MGAIIAWIVRGLAYAGPAAIGYFFNDLATWVASLMPSTKVTDSAGRYSWWFVLSLAAIAGAAVLFVLNMFKGKKKSLFAIGAIAALGLDYFLGGMSSVEVITAGFIGTIAAASSASSD